MINLLSLSYSINTRKITKELRLKIRSELSELDSIFISTSETKEKTIFYIMFNSNIEANIVLKRINEVKQILKDYNL